MIKVFKTDVDDIHISQKIKAALLNKYAQFRIDFDLEDSDNIMRIEGEFFEITDIESCLKSYGHSCIDLPIDLY